MTICPVALVIGCEKCLIVKSCPLKTALGNYVEPPPPKSSKKKTGAWR